MNIRVDFNAPIKDGTELVFRSPEDCSKVTGLIVYYPDNGVTASREFAFADAHRKDVGSIDYLSVFGKGAVVKVILDLDTNMAFIQNPDTNAYLEGRFAELEAKKSIIPKTASSFEDLFSTDGLVVGSLYLITESDEVFTYMGLRKGDVFLATSVDSYERQMNIIGDKGDPGKSAYEIAIDNGFDGQEQEWLESLKGKPGKDGQDYVLADADKEEIVQSVIESLPIYGGETEEVVANE